MEPVLERELKTLRKQLYTYHNRLLEVERGSRNSFDGYDYRFRINQLENADPKEQSSSETVLAFHPSDNTPLQNEYILEMITTYLPSQSLRNCRLVCRLWNKEMCRSLMARRNLIVTEEDEPEAESILQNTQKTCVVAVGSICFFDLPPACTLYKRLLAYFGWTLSSLKLEECGRSAQDLANVLMNQAPHLESFSYKDRALAESQRSSTFKIMKSLLPKSTLMILPDLKRLHWDEEFGKVELEEIISMCPNLIELVYKNIPVPATTSYEKLRWESLRTLKISPRDELRDEHVISLTSLKLKLTRLTMFGINPKEKNRMKNLGKFLKSISSTLEELELFQHYSIASGYNDLYESPFCVDLPHLTRLNLDFCLLKSVSALSYLPQLKSLECKAKAFTDWGAVLGNPGFEVEKNHTLQYLNLGSIDEIHLLKFAIYFSSCNSLELDPEHVNDAAMGVIIRNLPHLQHLKIAKHGSAFTKLPLTDAGLSGLNVSTCKRLCETATSRSSMVNLGDNLSEEKNFPAIYQLKDLIRLEIHADESLITDVGVVLGIAKCSKLNILGLSKCDISDVSLKAIQENLKLTLLDFSKCSNFSDTAITALQKTHKTMIFQSDIHGLPGLILNPS